MRYLALLLVGLTVAFSAAAQPCHDAAEPVAAEPAVVDETVTADPPSTAATHRCGARAATDCGCCLTGSAPIAPTTPRATAPTTAAAVVGAIALTAPLTAPRPADAPVRGPPAPEVSSGHGPRGPPPTA